MLCSNADITSYIVFDQIIHCERGKREGTNHHVRDPPLSKRAERMRGGRKMPRLSREGITYYRLAINALSLRGRGEKSSSLQSLLVPCASTHQIKSQEGTDTRKKREESGVEIMGGGKRNLTPTPRHVVETRLGTL